MPEADRRIVIGIDPGLTSGAVVALSSRPEEVLAARSFVRAIPAVDVPVGDRAFTRAQLHARNQAASFAAAVREISHCHGAPFAIGIESFIDQPSKARSQTLLKDRWKTPLMIGMLASMLDTDGYSVDRGNLFYQDPSILRHFSTEIGLLARGGKGRIGHVVCVGDQLITNDHMRKAWAHATWLNARTGKDAR